MKSKKNEIQVGNEVLIKGSSIKGLLIAIDDKKNICSLEIKGKILKIPLTELKQCATGKTRPEKSRSEQIKMNSRKNPGSNNTSRIDLHGKTRDEARELLVDLLDKALLSGCSKLEIIHGHGNGIIKDEVHRFLKNSPHIASYRLQEHNTGTTLAWLS